MKSDFLRYEESDVHFIKFGSGKRLLIALHGFGDRASLFQSLEEALSPYYTVYAIDLPYHGLTRWHKSFFTKTDIANLIRLIAKQEQQESFSLMGYSFGGRIVQTLLFEFVEWLEHVYLIAPDGIQTKWMFNLTLMPNWLRLVTKNLLREPHWFMRFLEIVYRRGLISKFIHDFAYNHIKTEERRERIFCTWISLNDFANNPKKVKKLLADSRLPVDLYFGRRDEVIPVSAGEWLSKDLENVHLHILEEGHLLVDKELNALLKQQLEVKVGIR